jgi:hypothetical protein
MTELRSLHPPMLMPGHIGQDALARLVVNQADDECPHDRPPVVGSGIVEQVPVSGWLRRLLKMVSSDGLGELVPNRRHRLKPGLRPDLADGMKGRAQGVKRPAELHRTAAAALSPRPTASPAFLTLFRAGPGVHRRSPRWRVPTARATSARRSGCPRGQRKRR